MEPYELRIHYAANNMVSEDARWIRVAQETARFNPTKRFRLSDTPVRGSTVPAQTPGSYSQTDGPTQSVYISSQSDLVSRSYDPPNTPSNIANERTAPSTRKRNSSGSFAGPSATKYRRSSRSSSIRTKKSLDVGSRTPILGYLKSRKACLPSAKTPRHRLLPETTFLVPVTKSPRRLCADATSTRRGLDQIGSESPQMHGCIDETSFTDHSDKLTRTLEATLPAESWGRNSVCSFGSQSYPCDQERLLRVDHRTRQCFTHELDTLPCTSQTGIREIEISIGTEIAQSTHDCLKSTPNTTTATPSDSGTFANNSSPLAQKSNKCWDPANAVVDLTSSPNQGMLNLTRRDVLGPLSSPIIRTRMKNTRDDTTKGVRMEEVFSVPRKAMCKPTCTVKSRPFESFVPCYLLDLAEKFELRNQFRPVSAPKTMQNSDRGYWNLRIKVADAAVVAQARRPPLTSSQWSDQRFMMRQEGLLRASAPSQEANDILRHSIYSNKDPMTYVPWTVPELETFWAYLTKVIERGQAGYDVHATLKRAEPRSADLDVDIKLYGYAESLSHLWLLLYGVSGTLTANMPLQWYVPGVGPLISMSGQVKRGGRLGRWTPKEAGVTGSWGLEDN